MLVTTLFVVDDELPLADLPANTLSFETYLRDYPKLNEGRTRIINLCDTRRYLSQGYYCSLLAEARHHEVLPSVRMINDLRDGESQGIWLRTSQLDEDALIKDGDSLSLLICMGQTSQPGLQKIASEIFRQFPAPLLHAQLTRNDQRLQVQLVRSNLAELDSTQQAFCWQVMSDYGRSHWHRPGGRKRYRWEMALLINPDEPSPPSNRTALNRFIRAGRKLGIKVQTVTAAELSNLNQYDALFIRETTAIDHPTYRLACDAEKNGLVVLDDPDSILRCCNKAFLHDAFNYRKVPSLRTRFVYRLDEAAIEQLEQELSYPLVLKLPEGSFSRGVFKVENRQQLVERLQNLFETSALVLAQEYLYTDYDWRIGVLNGRALYACRYYMARNHWQIYNHSSKRFSSGGFDTLPTFEIPRAVLEAALKSAAVVGKGLYGIDIKWHNDRAHVIEVNDNPSIDAGVEDKYLGEELYMQIMSEFLRRLELRGAQ